MIAALLVTCFLEAGVLYAPPPEWTVVQVGIVGMRNVCTGNNCLAINVVPIEKSFVVIRRPVKAGGKIEVPAGCQAEIVTR